MEIVKYLRHLERKGKLTIFTIISLIVGGRQLFSAVNIQGASSSPSDPPVLLNRIKNGTESIDADHCDEKKNLQYHQVDGKAECVIEERHLHIGINKDSFQNDRVAPSRDECLHCCVDDARIDDNGR